MQVTKGSELPENALTPETVTPHTNQLSLDFSKMEATIMMISRSGDILEILTSMYLYIFLSKYARSASYQHNTTYTNDNT